MAPVKHPLARQDKEEIKRLEAHRGKSNVCLGIQALFMQGWLQERDQVTQRVRHLSGSPVELHPSLGFANN